MEIYLFMMFWSVLALYFVVGCWFKYTKLGKKTGYYLGHAAMAGVIMGLAILAIGTHLVFNRRPKKS